VSISYKDIEENAQRELKETNSIQELEILRVKYLGRKGIIAQEISKIPTLAFSERSIAGQQLNELKRKLNDLIEARRPLLIEKTPQQKHSRIDITLPGVERPLGSQHPIINTMNQICGIFVSLGFQLYEGPEVETEYHNFQALNIALEHPSRDAFDTFYLAQESRYNIFNDKLENNSHINISNKLLLRSHTSPGQIRVMQQIQPPVAAVVPGRVYRPDATDASHSCMFHQVEGFLVDSDIRFSDLKGILESFAKQMFGPQIKMRFRPHYFPFTEPSAEVDISCIICGSAKTDKTPDKPCSVCKGKGWLEILGCGMIHPNVFKNVGYDHKKYTGFAFGMGVERIAMLKHGIDDIRIFFENDLKFLKQF